ncbi:MAG: energy-coupling factor transporter transmembrane component T family protein [Candidatus Anstonellales archaeon]
MVVFASFVEKETVIHRTHPAVKVVWLLFAFALFFVAKTPLVPLVFFLFMVVFAFAGKVAGIFFKSLLVFILPIGISLLIMHAYFAPLGGEETVEIFSVKLYVQGIVFSSLMLSKICALVSSFFLFIFTTNPVKLSSAFAEFGMPYKLGFFLNAGLQIIPLMYIKANKVLEAQMARGLRVKGSLEDRFKAYIPLLGPVIIGSVVETFERAIALEVRGLSIEGKKTHYHVVNFRMVDKIVLVLSVLLNATLVGMAL